jgi:hypothetical protein
MLCLAPCRHACRARRAILKPAPQIQNWLSDGSLKRLVCLSTPVPKGAPVREGLWRAAVFSLSFLALQHLFDEWPNVHLDCVEFTLKYRDRVRKVVDNLGTGRVNLGRCKMALLRGMTGAMANNRDIIDTNTSLGDLTSGLTGIAAATAGLRDAPISRGGSSFSPHDEARFRRRLLAPASVDRPNRLRLPGRKSVRVRRAEKLE